MTAFHHQLQWNFCQRIYVANCCLVKPSQWKGYSCAADQGLWTETVCLLILFIQFLRYIQFVTSFRLFYVSLNCRNPIPQQPFQFTSREFITYSTIRWDFMEVTNQATLLLNQRRLLTAWLFSESGLMKPNHWPLKWQKYISLIWIFIKTCHQKMWLSVPFVSCLLVLV
jgi:hypothetical protein